MDVSPKDPIIERVMGRVQHYNHAKYWKRRKEVIDPHSRVPRLIRLYYLYYIKRCDAFNLSSMGTYMGRGAHFETPPRLPHHLNGIIVAWNARIGKNCTIYQRVTIARGDPDNGVVIGDNCNIGTGAVILGGVHIGDNVRIGANAVVTHDIPSNVSAAGVPARILNKEQV